MLDRAEDPEKMIKLMIREMEDTLVEIKAACAGAMAEKKKVVRRLEEVRERANLCRKGPVWPWPRGATTWRAKPWSKNAVSRP
jgi:hypothetical protein